MNILYDDTFVSEELLPQVNKIIKNYLESEYSYIENEDDLGDLEAADITDELIDTIAAKLNKLAKINFPKEDITYDNEELYSIVESAFEDYKDIMIQKYNEQFEKEEFIDEFYQDYNDYYNE